MRIQMKISRDTVLAIQQIKELEYDDPNIPVTNGYLVGIAYKRIAPKIKNIVWKNIVDAEIPNVTNNKDSSVSGVKTTLNLEESTLFGINELQQELGNIFTRRIHKSFVVKLVLFAAILDYHDKL